MKMKKEEARKLFDPKKWEEITWNEFTRLNSVGELDVHCENGNMYFKPKDKYPKLFNGYKVNIVVREDGRITLYWKRDSLINDTIINISEDKSFKALDNNDTIINISEDKSFKALDNALKLSKTLRK